jgi:hypothetical protein
MGLEMIIFRPALIFQDTAKSLPDKKGQEMKL